MAGEKTITLTQEQMQEVQAILMDLDGEAALKFLRDVIRPQITEKRSHACGPLEA